MNNQEVVDTIVSFLKKYALENGKDGFVVGVSGGIDSAVVSTLCALTGMETLLVYMPIRMDYFTTDSFKFAKNHMVDVCWYDNVDYMTVNLLSVYGAMYKALPYSIKDNDLSMVNAKSRLRMTTLYSVACSKNLLVCGTGNKVEDFGVGFFTKYGDGGVDISPIGDLMKSEVYELGKHLGVSKEILEAAPTDGLWDDGRTDEDALGLTYDEIEWAMKHVNEPKDSYILCERELIIIDRYIKLRDKSVHKMNPIPVCCIPKELKG